MNNLLQNRHRGAQLFSMKTKIILFFTLLILSTLVGGVISSKKVSASKVVTDNPELINNMKATISGDTITLEYTGSTPLEDLVFTDISGGEDGNWKINPPDIGFMKQTLKDGDVGDETIRYDEDAEKCDDNNPEVFYEEDAEYEGFFSATGWIARIALNLNKDDESPRDCDDLVFSLSPNSVDILRGAYFVDKTYIIFEDSRFFDEDPFDDIYEWREGD